MRASAWRLGRLGLVGWLAACGHAPAPAPVPPVTPAVVAPPPAPVAVTLAQLHGPIKSFSITGGEDIDYLRLQPLFNDEVGKPMDPARLRGKLDKAMEGQTLADLDVRGEQLADGIKLVVHVRPQPKVTAAAMRDATGKEVTPPPALAGMVGARLAPAELDALVAALRQQFENEGRAGSGARWGVAKAGDGVAITLEANEGERLVIATRTYDGAVKVKPADLDHALPEPLVGMAWIPDKIERAAYAIQGYYWDHGFAQVAIHIAPPPAHNPATIAFQITEGPVFHLGRLEVTGVPPADVKRILGLLKLKTGLLFNRAQIAAARDTVIAALVKEGHPKAAVLPQTTVDPDKHTIAISFQVALDGA